MAVGEILTIGSQRGGGSEPHNFWMTLFVNSPLLAIVSGAKEHVLNLCKLKLYPCLPDLFIDKIQKLKIFHDIIFVKV